MRLAVATLTFTLASATTVTAQSLADVCSSVRDLTVGQWAGYTMVAGGDRGEVRFSIVGTEEVDGITHYWQETSVRDGDQSMVMKLLIAEYPFSSGDIRRAVMKAGDQPAMEVPEQMLNMMPQQPGESPAQKLARQCNDAEVVGWEDISVAGGEFNAMHIRPTDNGQMIDLWISPDVPFGMVKMVSPRGENLELTGHGTDATTAITETPQRMPGM